MAVNFTDDLEGEALKVISSGATTSTIAIVNFRPTASYTGEYGFDWFRDGESIASFTENYWALLRSGYVADASKNYKLNKAEALTRVEESDFYRMILINDTTGIIPPNSNNAKYFTSFLNIYTEGISDDINMMREVRPKSLPISPVPSTPFVIPKPPYEVDLVLDYKALVDLDRIELEYDENYFEIDKPVLTTSIAKDATGTVPIKIKCRKKQPETMGSKIQFTPPTVGNDGFDKEKEINVWAYEKGSTTVTASGKNTVKTAAELRHIRHLAGRMVVMPNGIAKQKHIDIAFINVNLNVATSIRTTELGSSIKEHMHKTLYQALIDCNIVEGFYLDVSSDPKFANDTIFRPSASPKYAYPPNTFRFPTGPICASLDAETANEAIYDHLEALFDTKYPSHQDYILVFVIDEEEGLAVIDSSTSNMIQLFGQAKKLKSRSLILFKDYSTQIAVVSHELLHCLGLPHSFDNLTPRLSPEQKLVYTMGQTANVMDYSPNMRYTWRWQWKLINS